jgi:hypothetical protein
LIQHDQQPVSLSYFVDAHACLTGAVAGFADDATGFVEDILSRPDDDHRQRDRHDVCIDNSLCF